VFNDWAVKRRTGLWEEYETLLKKQKIVGMTTTGFSKYRGLLAAC
jgi:helicase required for RNAi-mediated heterochromatin assembly 1